MNRKNILRYFWIEYILLLFLIPVLLITLFIFDVRYGWFFVLVLIGRAIYRPLRILTLDNKGLFENSDYIIYKNNLTLIIDIGAVFLLILFLYLILQNNIFGFTSPHGVNVVLIFVLIDIFYNIFIFYNLRISKTVNAL